MSTRALVLTILVIIYACFSNLFLGYKLGYNAKASEIKDSTK